MSNKSQTVRFEHKCRRCGTIYTDSGIGAAYATTQMVKFLLNKEMNSIHTCADGGMGISDLIGSTPPIPV